MSRVIELLDTLKQWLDITPEAVETLDKLPGGLREEGLRLVTTIALEVLHSDVGELMAVQGAANQGVLRAFGSKFIRRLVVRGDVGALHVSRNDDGSLRIERMLFGISSR